MTNKINTNLNISPYWDDFDEDKQYVRILFKPSVAVQTRELNQIQTILQNQISRFGSHIFKDGSIVNGVAITYNNAQKYVRVKNLFNANNERDLNEIANTYLITSNTGVRAVPTLVVKGFETQYPDTNVLYIKYISTGKDVSNNDVTEFLSGETLSIYDENQLKIGSLDSNNLVDSIDVLTANASITVTGNAYAITCSDGIVYQKGYFSKVLPQTVLVKKYDTNTANYAVGFDTSESTVTTAQDSSLFDNAIGAPNEAAPGADRLKLTPSLISVNKDEISSNSSFFPIVEFNDSMPVEENTDPQYDILGDALAKTVWEESGDYVIKPFPVETLTHANSQLMYYEVSPGIGYVQGRRVELIGAKKIATTRAVDTDEGQAQIITSNYGNYVIVDEYLGNFDINDIATVSIYDTAQDAVSSVSGAGSAPTGNLIGTANIRSTVYDNGRKGTPSAQYRLYVFNIVMNSGKSFSNDAKSFYIDGSFGKAKADIVLESSKAVIKDSLKNTLLFDIGIDSIKRLTDKNGVNDTQFIIRDTISATLQSNGFATFTLNTPYAGGSERINYSTGTLSDTNELNFDITLSAEAYSANASGTLTAAGTTATGTGTSFTTVFGVDDFIRIPSSGAVRRVTAIANNTSMTLNASLTETDEAFQKYWPEGTVLDVSGANGSINVLSNTQFSVSTDVETAGGSGTQTIHANLPVLRSTAVGIKKEIKKDTYVKIDCSSAGVIGPFNLGLVDVTKLKNVYVGTDYLDTNPDRSVWFELNTGQTANTYEHAKLVVKPEFKSMLSTASRILVKLDHFVANTTAGAGFFSVDSYPIKGEADTSNSTNIDIGDIPTIGGLDTRRYIDYRLQRYNTANTATTIGGATVNPAAANTSFIKVSTGSYIPDPDSNFQADIEYYLPRIDLLSITKNGDLVVNNGRASLTPKSPKPSDDSMEIANIYVPGYPSLTTREGEAFNRTDIKTKINLVYNVGHTMKDIGTLKERIKRLEYYSVLNLLEQSAKDLTISDENGLDRFKNGFFAEPFMSHKLGNVSDFEYKIAIDADNKLARPFFEKHSIDYTLNSANSTNIQVSGSKVTLPYTSVEYIKQPYATKFRNCTESVWQWNGSISLYPEYDHHKNESSIPAVNVNIDLATPFEQFAASPFGTTFGDWRTVNQSTRTDVSILGNTQVTSSTTSTNQQRSQSILNVDVSSQTYNFGSFVKDISLNPYMRSREIAFVVTGLKPNTRMYAFFDSEPVSLYCGQGVLSGVSSVLEGQENRIVSRTNSFGSPMLTDSAGNLYGIFRIPDNMFRVGDREFVICNVDNLETGTDAILSAARAIYTASNLSVSTQQISLNTRTPSLSTSVGINTRVLTDTITNTGNLNNGFGGINGGGAAGGDGADPISQSFLVTTPNSTVMFLDKVGVYFKSKDPTLGVTVYITEMANGYPNSSKIIAKKYLPAASVNVSDDASLETVFNFDDVIALTRGMYYAFQVKPDGDSPEYTIWMSEIGGKDIASNQQVFSNPYVGVAFISANMNTWTAIQTEDIKFNIYRASFTSLSGTAYFENEDDDYITVDGLNKANSSVAVEVGDIVYSANSTGGLLTANTDPVGYIQRVDEARNSIIIDKSNGLFEANTPLQIHREFMNDQETLNANTLIATGNIVSIDNKSYSIIVPRFATIAPAGSSLEYSYKGTDESLIVDSVYYSVVPENDNEKFDKLRNIVSKSNEVADMSSAKSSRFNIILSSDNDYVSPVIDMTRKSSYVIENIINNDSTDEHTRYGNALTKYISRGITLEEGQDAEDIEIYVGAYRPVGSNIELYVKFLNNEDYESINDKVWTKMSFKSGEFTYSSTGNVKDFREYKFGLPIAVGEDYTAFANTDNNNIIQYTDANGSVYVGYKSFMIKVVLLSDNKVKVPMLSDLRAICLQI
jgi:hypothetical protein